MTNSDFANTTRRQIIGTTIGLVTGLAADSSIAAVPVQNSPALSDGEVFLYTLQTVPQLLPSTPEQKPVSISGIFCKNWFQTETVTAEITVNLDARFKYLRCVIGLDLSKNAGIGRFTITLDGKPIATGVLDREKPVIGNYDVTHGQSLTMVISRFVTVGNAIVGNIDKTSSANRPTPLSPANDATINENFISFEWLAIPGATSYLIQVMQIKRSGKKSHPDLKGWSLTAEDATSYKWNIADVPSGTYSWSVLGYQNDHLKGVFSPDLRFTIVR
jgi:hypothetical protein